MGSYVSPFLPSYQSTAAIAGGDRLECSSGRDFVGKRLQGSDPSSILLYRGGSRVLASPVVATSSRSFRGPDLSCRGTGRQPKARVPVATNKTVTPCGSKYEASHAVRSSTAAAHPPAPTKLDENFLANRATLSAPQTFRESATSYQLPQQAPRAARRRGARGKGRARACLDHTLPVFFSKDTIPQFYPTDFGYGAPGGTMGRGPGRRQRRRRLRRARRMSQTIISNEIIKEPALLNVHGVAVPQGTTTT